MKLTKITGHLKTLPKVIYDFRCTQCDHTWEEWAEQGIDSLPCPKCSGTSKRVWLTAPKLDWQGMAMGPNAGPEFVDHFEKSHKQQQALEAKSKREHGDYGRAPGS